MRTIANVEVTNLAFSYEPGSGYQTQRGRATGGLASFIRVTTSDGIDGLGPVYSHPDLLRIVVERQFRPMLIGSDPNEIEAIWNRLYSVTKWYGRKGIAISAVGGVDTALWDIRGHVEDKPIFELLGGAADRVDAYASGLLWRQNPEGLTGEVEQLRERGFRRFKTRTGINPEYDRRVVDAVIAGAGSSSDVLVDGAQRYPLPEAIAFGHYLADKDIFWFEEPFTPEAIDDYVALRREVNVRIAAGENEFGLQGFRELIRAGAIDIAQADASRAGGISECLRVARFAEQHDVLFAPHTWSDALSVVANAHVAAAAPNTLTVEVNQTGNPLVEELLEPRLEIADGKLAIPDGPGLGVALNRDALDSYSVPPGQPVADGHYSDMTFGRQWDWYWPPYPMPGLPEGPPSP